MPTILQKIKDVLTHSQSPTTIDENPDVFLRWTSHPLVKKNRRVVLASFLLLVTGVALIFTGVVIQLNPEAGVSSAIFFIPGFLLFIPGVYHVIYISCAVRGRRGFKFFYLPYFEK
ncbi:hypothetical protein J4Q44_G00391520 [Coregonus suidteri]|uniref:Transmembrane protein 134 n=1 Tax=Coregonus suidteri TaxID=861788 RepID=A0AAN8Q8Q4_9TELE